MHITTHRHLILLLSFMLLALAACKDDEPPKSIKEIDPKSPTFSVVQILLASGNSVDVIGGSTHPYFDTKNVLIRVNGGVDLELYEFSSKDDLEEAAKGVTHDASKINGTPITWQAAPHLFKTDMVIIVYAGDDRSNVDQLASVFGQQFAGK